METSVESTLYQRFFMTFNDSYLWVLILSLIFQVEGPVSAAGSSGFGMEKSRYCFLGLTIAITITNGLMLGREWMYSLSAHLDEMCIPWESLKLVYEKPQKSAIPVVLFSGDSYLTGREFSWVHKRRGFILVAVLYL